MRAKRFRQGCSKVEARFGMPLAFLLAASAQAAPETELAAGGVGFEPGALSGLGQGNSVEMGIGPMDAAKPQGGVSIDPATQTVQWFNWSNWFNCFSGAWRNC